MNLITFLNRFEYLRDQPSTQLIVPVLLKYFLHLALGAQPYSWPLLAHLLIPLPFPTLQFKCPGLSLGPVFPLSPTPSHLMALNTTDALMTPNGVYPAWISALNSRLGSSSAPWHPYLMSRALKLCFSKTKFMVYPHHHPGNLFLSSGPHLRKYWLFFLVARAESLVSSMTLLFFLQGTFSLSMSSFSASSK